ncbi:metalloregulator ArsR/SmtB family transcription factor [Anaerobiospirillum sp. NML120511]|uniref:ArsR/SmtB family transcription factor n=2 Tax=unclassified Anaerobiospirillum TaxID=2647410 RepID=UPI001FF13882|nr:metalloregulator ArsR/SmtB family transcription factor [Anaerobiospirillum sp. NML120511]MCK0535508.1 metalloregulator ArsR/SmtB family transcription factor [Anaerobiospirillum sp. NML120511]
MTTNSSRTSRGKNATAGRKSKKASAETDLMAQETQYKQDAPDSDSPKDSSESKSSCSCGCCAGKSVNHAHELALANGELMSSDDIEVLSAFFKALSDPSRLNIVYLLLQHKQLSVGDIASKTNMSVSAVSHQLAILRMRKLVTVKRDGVKNYYGLCDDHVFKVIEMAIEHIKEE